MILHVYILERFCRPGQADRKLANIGRMQRITPIVVLKPTNSEISQMAWTRAWMDTQDNLKTGDIVWGDTVDTIRTATSGMRRHTRRGQEEQTAGICSHLTDFCELRTHFDQTRGDCRKTLFRWVLSSLCWPSSVFYDELTGEKNIEFRWCTVEFFCLVKIDAKVFKFSKSNLFIYYTKSWHIAPCHQTVTTWHTEWCYVTGCARGLLVSMLTSVDISATQYIGIFDFTWTLCLWF